MSDFEQPPYAPLPPAPGHPTPPAAPVNPFGLPPAPPFQAASGTGSIGTFALMALAGFSINTLTLLALVLAIGLVVDDSIVMLENIFRHIEEGMTPFQAAIRGAREVGFAIVAMTMTLVAVYAPLAFAPGRTGRLFTEFALALAGAVLITRQAISPRFAMSIFLNIFLSVEATWRAGTASFDWRPEPAVLRSQTDRWRGRCA